MDLIYLSAMNYAINIIYTFTAILIVFIFLRRLDKISKLKWSEVRKLIITDPKAASLYYGLRFLGVAIILAFMMSR